MTDSIAKPVPTPNAFSRECFAGAARGAFLLQRCRSCGAWRDQVRRRCDRCGSSAADWAPASGKAKLITHVWMHREYHPAFAGELPYNIAVVELEEGPRMMTHLVGIDGVDLKAGLALTVVFEEAAKGIWIPKFRPAESNPPASS